MGVDVHQIDSSFVYNHPSNDSSEVSFSGVDFLKTGLSSKEMPKIGSVGSFSIFKKDCSYSFEEMYEAFKRAEKEHNQMGALNNKNTKDDLQVTYTYKGKEISKEEYEKRKSSIEEKKDVIEDKNSKLEEDLNKQLQIELKKYGVVDVYYTSHTILVRPSISILLPKKVNDTFRDDITREVLDIVPHNIYIKWHILENTIKALHTQLAPNDSLDATGEELC
jgi:NAD+--asparagine ADP-ribosyltransferase